MVLALARPTMLAYDRPPNSSYRYKWKDSKQGYVVIVGSHVHWSCDGFSTCSSYNACFQTTARLVVPIHVEREQAGLCGYCWLACGLVLPWFRHFLTYCVSLRATPRLRMPIHAEREQAGLCGYCWLAYGLVL